MIWGEASGAVVKEADRIKRMGERQGWKEGGKELEGGERMEKQENTEKRRTEERIERWREGGGQGWGER